jgi:hypothetical protein
MSSFRGCHDKNRAVSMSVVSNGTEVHRMLPQGAPSTRLDRFAASRFSWRCREPTAQEHTVARNLPPVMMPLNASCYAAFGLRLRLNMHTFLMKLIGPCLAACGVGITGSSQRTNSSSYLKVHELKCALLARARPGHCRQGASSTAC